ncbi:hypothetical protein GA0115250_11161 [Streptomyces sp. BvitLS-983]|nr:hypothetical protein GA0115250_11161 [Streptomyces sp. BvitLS-983]
MIACMLVATLVRQSEFGGTIRTHLWCNCAEAALTKVLHS